jgi:hypothetical protein
MVQPLRSSSRSGRTGPGWDASLPLALAAPLLTLLSLLMLLQRHGLDRWQVLPALLIGISLMLFSLWSRQRRRRALLLALRGERH